MSQEYLYCEHCLRWTHVRGKGCADCLKKDWLDRRQQEWAVEYQTEHWQRYFAELPKWRAQVAEQREAERRERRPAFRRLMWRLVAIWVAVVVVVPLIARALN